MNSRPQAWLDQAINDLDLGCTPPHTHQLSELVDTLAQLGAPTEELRPLRLNALSRMATSTRYPDDDRAPLRCFDQQDANEAIACAAAVLSQANRWDRP